MASYRLQIRKSAAKEIEDLPKKDRLRVVERIRTLAANPRQKGAEKLSGEDKYRVRQGIDRIVYGIDDRQLVVTVVKVGHHREIYR